MKKFCYNCLKEVEPQKVEKKEKFVVRNKEYEYISIKSLCPYCNKDVELLDEDIDRRDEAFRKEEGLILNSEIEKILNMYKIGKKPLAKLLGWSEVTIIRYLNGETPNRLYSDELYKILESSKYMEQLLIRNKENITEKAFNSCIKALKRKDNESEINLIANYIIQKVDITPLALEKILYYCQAFYLAFFGEKMFRENCEAWRHGPVYPVIYHKYKNYSYETINEKSEFYFEEIIDEEKKKVVDNVIKSFSVYSSKILERMTHLEEPWIRARHGLSDDENSNNVIEISDIKKYFENIIDKYNIEEIDQINKYSKDMFEKIMA